MADAYNFLNGTQADINRRLLRRIEALESGEVGEIGRLTALETAVGSKDTDAGSLKKRFQKKLGLKDMTGFSSQGKGISTQAK